MKIDTLVSLLSLTVVRTLADDDVFHNDTSYDAAMYGSYPIQKYITTDVVSPWINVLQSSPECDTSMYTVLTPRGESTAEPSATILDPDGHLVWTTGGYNQIYNLMVQDFKGEQYLTFWAGNDAVGGHGAGYYYMLDKNYDQVAKIGAVHGFDGDLHEFRLTENGTALITVYQVVNTDLSAVGREGGGPVWDCLIQEIDIETGELVFQWRALQHYSVADTYKPLEDDGVTGRPWDFFHINSIAKDSKGNYLTSSRYMHSLTYINGSSGEVIWIIGGKRNMFKDLSGGQATNFAYQHDARWSDNETTITMFDNGVDDPHPRIADTRGLRIKIDQDAMTARVATIYRNPRGIHGISQGSLQTLPNGNTFLGYGNTAAFTEYSHDGKVLCDTHYGPESRFGAGEIQSYRIYKFEWHAWPTTKPDVALAQSTEGVWYFYVSWNGATEISEWVLQGASDPEARAWEDLDSLEKFEFESEFEVLAEYPRYLRTVALDEKGHVLGKSSPLDTKMEKVWTTPELKLAEDDTWTLKMLVLFCSAFGLGFGIREAFILWSSRRQCREGQDIQESEPMVAIDNPSFVISQC